MNARRFLGAALAVLCLILTAHPAEARRARVSLAPVPVAGAMVDDRYAHMRSPEAHATARAWSDLGAAAGRFLGSNPTGWAHVWCGRFLRMLVPRDPGPAFDAAREWRRYGRDAGGPTPGAIGVMPHHVGVVIGRCEGGGVLLRSGNHNRTVGDGCYAARRFIAWRV